MFRALFVIVVAPCALARIEWRQGGLEQHTCAPLRTFMQSLSAQPGACSWSMAAMYPSDAVDFFSAVSVDITGRLACTSDFRTCRAHCPFMSRRDVKCCHGANSAGGTVCYLERAPLPSGVVQTGYDYSHPLLNLSITALVRAANAFDDTWWLVFECAERYKFAPLWFDCV